MHEGAELESLDVKVSACTHLRAAGFNSFLGGVDPSPTQPSSLVGGTIDASLVNRKSWLDGGSAYGGQRKMDLSTLAGAEDVLFLTKFAHPPQPTLALKGGTHSKTFGLPGQPWGWGLGGICDWPCPPPWDTKTYIPTP